MENENDLNEMRRVGSDALTLCAGKVAAVSGDLRMALGLMRQSVKRAARTKNESLRSKVLKSVSSFPGLFHCNFSQIQYDE